jgi:Ner family transcriptional regulator
MCPDIETHEIVKARLRIVGTSLSAIARELSVSHSTVTIVSQGHRKSARIQEMIASKIGVDPQDIWPDRYSQEVQKKE